MTLVACSSCFPLQCSCLENPRDGGAWWAAVYGVAQSRTLTRRSSSSSSSSSCLFILFLYNISCFSFIHIIYESLPLIVIWGHYEYCCYNHMFITNIINIIYMSFHLYVCKHMGFPGSSAGKESVCNAGDPSLIPALGRSPVEGIGFLLQYSWASLVAQLVKNSPAMWETWV